MLQGLAFSCVDIPKETSIESLLNVKQEGSRWLQQDLDDNWVPFDKNQHLRVIPLKGRNWTGIGFLTDETVGDELQRTRRFKFCLQHISQALCGDTPVELLSKSDSDELPKLETILRSIEFVDDVSVTSHSAVAPGQAK